MYTRFPVDWVMPQEGDPVVRYEFNSHRSADGSIDESGVDDNTIIDHALRKVIYRDLRDPYHLSIGGGLGRVHKGMLMLDLSGRLLVPDEPNRIADLEDKIRDFRQAFDPSECLRLSGATEGAFLLRFSEATTDTSTYPDGRIDQQYWARPVDQPTITENQGQPGSCPYSLTLVAADPRAYEREEQTLVLTPASSSGVFVNHGNVPTPVQAEIIMNGPGASNFTMQPYGFVLDLSDLADHDSVAVTFETCAPYGEGRRIDLNGNRAFGLKSSDADTWFMAVPGNAAISIQNTTGVTSCTFRWRSARA